MMFRSKTPRLMLIFALSLALICLLNPTGILAQRGGGGGDNDEDFDDAGFDDSGYNSPQPVDAEGSNQNQNYSPSSDEDLDDDDDDADATNVKPQMASHEDESRREQQIVSPPPSSTSGASSMEETLASMGPQQFYNSPDAMMLTNVNMDRDQQQQADPTTSSNFNGHQMRFRRSINRHDQDEAELDIEDIDPSAIASSSPENKQHLSRNKRSLSEEQEADDASSSLMVKINEAVDATTSNSKEHRRVKRHSKYIGPVYTYVKTDKHARFKWGVKHKVAAV